MNDGNDAGAIYVGKMFISSSLQPLRLIFDTGSDYMAVTSELCTESRESLAQRENEKKGKEENEGQLFDPATQASLINIDQVQARFLDDHRFLQTNDNVDVTNLMIKDDDSTTEAVKKLQANSKKPKCDTQAYAIKTENEVKDMKSDFLQLKYGSADLGGFLYQDKLCLDPLGNRCASDF